MTWKVFAGDLKLLVPKIADRNPRRQKEAILLSRRSGFLPVYPVQGGLKNVPFAVLFTGQILIPKWDIN